MSGTPDPNLKKTVQPTNQPLQTINPFKPSNHPNHQTTQTIKPVFYAESQQ
jgi:hypothetical protein